MGRPTGGVSPGPAGSLLRPRMHAKPGARNARHVGALTHCAWSASRPPCRLRRSAARLAPLLWWCHEAVPRAACPGFPPVCLHLRLRLRPGCPPCSIPYSMEVMKGGAMLGSLDLGAQSFYTFGRVPTNDVVLDHPSSSRQAATRPYGMIWPDAPLSLFAGRSCLARTCAALCMQRRSGPAHASARKLPCPAPRARCSIVPVVQRILLFLRRPCCCARRAAPAGCMPWCSSVPWTAPPLCWTQGPHTAPSSTRSASPLASMCHYGERDEQPAAGPSTSF